jgi:hypothetical protein
MQGPAAVRRPYYRRVVEAVLGRYHTGRLHDPTPHMDRGVASRARKVPRKFVAQKIDFLTERKGANAAQHPHRMTNYLPSSKVTR